MFKTIQSKNLTLGIVRALYTFSIHMHFLEEKEDLATVKICDAVRANSAMMNLSRDKTWSLRLYVKYLKYL